MRKIFFIVLIILFLTSCAPQYGEVSQVTKTEDVTTSSTQLTSEEDVTLPEKQEKISFSKNYIIDGMPKSEKVTTEIIKELVGKYVNSEDENSYFEIFDDGTFVCKFPYYNGERYGNGYIEGYHVFDSNSLVIFAYYGHDETFLSFVSINENVYFDYGLAVNFYSMGSEDFFSSFNSNLGTYVLQK